MSEYPPQELVEWDARAYHRLSDPQLEWGRKVLARLDLHGDETVMDAGCGTGRVSAELLERLPGGKVIAVDRSQNMIDEARTRLAPRFGSRILFRCADLQAITSDEPVDVVFSTATFHWVLDHDVLFRHLFGVLKLRGRLVAQCGGAGNLERLLERAAVLKKSEPFASFFAGSRDPWVFHDDVSTAARLRAAGFVDVSADLEPADTQLPDAASYCDFLERVIFGVHFASAPDSDLAARFAARLTDQAAADDPPFVLDYRRLNIVASRPCSPLGP